MAHAIADKSKLLSTGNTTLPAGAGRMLSIGLLAIGAIALVLTVLGALLGDETAKKVALASYHVGFLVTLGLTLGSMILVMVFHQVNAGWSATIRRQLENVMSLVPVCLVFFLPVAILAPIIFHWMDPHYTEGDVIYEAKKSFLNEPFFYVRAVIYFGAWLYFSQRLYRLSIGQDADGDRFRTAKARRMSSYGLLIMALTTAFAAFDWMMSLDYHWFSTMFGVYFFAGFVGVATSLCALILIMLRRAGSLDGLVTNEHLHDLGKLMFGFVVFWAYIGFSQYFLIWYGNIPEETMWFQLRRSDGWMPYSIALAFGRFIIPFIVLMARPARRNPMVLAVVAVWLLAFHTLDTFWVVRPTVYGADHGPVFFGWLDAVAILGPVCIFFGLLARRVVNNPLVPVNDPRMDEAIAHKNYV